MRWLRRDSQPTLVDRLRPQIKIERESRQNSSSGKVAILAHHSSTPRVTRSVDVLARNLLDADYAVTLVSSSPVNRPLEFHPYVAAGLTVVRKPNLGYDFGSWAVGLDLVGGLRDRDPVLLVNDSMLGPFWTIAPILDSLETTSADVFCLTDSEQFSYHPQSYFVGYRRGVLTERPLARFWADIAHHENKDEVIGKGELAQGSLLRDNGYAVAAYVTSRRVVDRGVNPVIHGWARLLDMGVPFVKRQLLTEPWVAVDGEQVPGHLLSRYEVDVKEWM